jgi:FkbH-like protein
MLLEQASTELQSQNYEQVYSLLSSVANEQVDYRTSTEILDLWAAIPEEVKTASIKKTVRVAFISGATTDHLLPLLDLFLGLKHIKAEFWSSTYQIDAISLSRDPALEAFRPDFCVLQADTNDIQHWPELACEDDAYAAALNSEVSRWAGIRNDLKGWLNCEIVQESIPALIKRPLGSIESRIRGARSLFVADLNHAILKSMTDGARWHDVSALSASLGGRIWRDARLWHHAKFGISPDAAPSYCFSLSALIASSYGFTKKCLVLDLDNTLWGGVIGDDGHQGVVIGEGSGDGEAFKEFQTYAKQLKNRGVLLAVCSKNDAISARSGFEKIAETVLRLEDFDAFIANWDRKSENIGHLAKKLNIGIQSLVFFDDNPVEREEVRSVYPEVLIVDVPDDPAQFSQALDAYHAFEQVTLTKDDLERAGSYRNERIREEFANSATSFEEYLSKLRMEADIEPFSEADVPRISQLINKTNQFNLTTRRYSEAECMKFLDRERYITRSVRLQDRFGNYGLISVFIAEILKPERRLQVDSWLMSCRVLKRGVEHALFCNVLNECEKLSIGTIDGIYRPTNSNRIVEGLFASLGFSEIKRLPEETQWRLPAPFSYPSTHIAVSHKETGS